MGLVLCATCVRHVKRHEHTCPFCGSALGHSDGGSRALTAAVMIGIGLAVGACGGEDSSPVAGDAAAVTGGAGGATAVPLYAAVIPDSGSSIGGSGGDGGATATPLYAAVVGGGGGAAGGAVVLYAAVPLDSGAVTLYRAVPFQG